MTDETEEAEIKLLDFGLGKIVGPNEFTVEPYGTVVISLFIYQSYVAPEILLDKPYTKAVDMWSLGVIVKFSFNMISCL